MGKVIALGDFVHKLRKAKFDKRVNKMVDDIEKEFGLEDEQITLLSEDVALTLANTLIDARDNINDCMAILGVSETDRLPNGLTDGH